MKVHDFEHNGTRYEIHVYTYGNGMMHISFLRNGEILETCITLPEIDLDIVIPQLEDSIREAV
ncbi:hypothetical protein INT08_08395 [Prosthecochloris sp. N3]|uniref:Uncharacterized protein n=1 Tax=Prosthecochloris ethylica TaxID=2743976 RepID=A0ABR9XT41_9CHLB|nr:hypothetical protein [Prosthecochloris ethylica]MBF0586935.1 hypothetical protein [Prosthecochloris ethylica]MBF0637188.1 hypothetical protein [Prosthecochloris ethylica]NUK48196.1 hypothetical protein [Prosthecochloris ethylica]